MEDTIPPLPSAEQIRQLAQQIVHRPIYDLGPGVGGEPLITYVARMLRKFLGPLYDWFDSLWQTSPATAAILLAIIFLVLIALVGHIVYTFQSALKAPRDLRSVKLATDAAVTSAELEQRARAAAKKGEFVEAIRLLFMASLLTLETAQKRLVRRGTTNREYLKRYKNTPAFDPLYAQVELLDRTWYAGAPCSEQDYQDSLRAFATIQQTVRAAKPPATPEAARA